MKKCASCTKDLPEAALHCVFCGAKQPPAPAVQPGLAKTAFGYSNEMMEHLRQVAAAPQAPGPAPAPRSNPPSQPPLLRGNPPSQPPPMRGNPPSQPPPYAPYPQPPVGGLADAATLFVPNGGQPQPPQQQPIYAQATLAAPPPLQPMPMQQPYPQQPYAQQPQQPHNGGPQFAGRFSAPGMAQPYAPPHAAASDANPWRDSLKVVMIVWGLLVIAALATPLSLDPTSFSWDVLIHGEGSARIPFLAYGALGVLGVVVSLLPMPTFARGLFAALLGLGALAVPIAIAGALPGWHELLALGCVLLIVPALLIRSEYTHSQLARIIVTLCVVGFLVPYLLPQHGDIPLVLTFKALMNAEGVAKVVPIVAIARIALVVLALLVWMPGPATAGGAMFAWLIILAVGIGMSLLDVGVGAATGGHVLDTLEKTPAAFALWIIPTACLVFAGYGLATVLGKPLE